MQKTNIEYLTHTWNPIAMRCTPVSFGCDNCWHLRMANRLGGCDFFASDVKHAYRGDIGPVIRTRELSAPLRLKKPSVIGVQFMGDIFHEKVTNEMIAAVFGVMAACPQHTFVVLTKRPERALEFLSGNKICPLTIRLDVSWPLQNVWFGVSIEDQKTADERIPLLLQIPAAKRFVSAEPLLERTIISGQRCYVPYTCCDGYECGCMGLPIEPPPYLDWVICGSETGPGKRPMNLEWARSLRDQCKSAGVPFFFKKDSDGNHTLDGVVHEEMPK